jgi:hypothetical protein
MSIEKLKRCRKELLDAIHKLDNCWGHHQDGSDLMVSNSELFNIVFNDVMHNIRKPLKRIDDMLGGTNGNSKCVSCGLPKNNGSLCPHCNG